MVVMERGHRSLRDHIYDEKQQITFLATINILVDIAKGMRFLHKKNIVHRYGVTRPLIAQTLSV